ncbi:hypothetical protein OS493_034755 [Desmophyllum pertusum]|uniref:Uncharacterized protein n=1 Tax=Desmophyllum pertusum TaxID=174260 RepID=A0A9W9YV72_9CNID|nr:hypothetical protein OS493_034755 [Desmophyllum pertusum]
MKVAVAEDTIVVIHFPSKGKKLTPGNAKVQHKNSKKKVKQTSLPDTRWSGISMAHGTGRNLNLNSIFQLNSVDNRVVSCQKRKTENVRGTECRGCHHCCCVFFRHGRIVAAITDGCFLRVCMANKEILCIFSQGYEQ